MKLTDVDYDEYQNLIQKAKELDRILNDDTKFYRINMYGDTLFIRNNETDLIRFYKEISEKANRFNGIIENAAYVNKMTWAEFVSKHEKKWNTFYYFLCFPVRLTFNQGPPNPHGPRLI